MKETVNVNIASQAFTLDDDAYAALRRYLDDIGRRLPPEDTDTMEDVEARIAEIFRERLSSPIMVVSLGTVRHAMEQLGQPDDFGECRADDAHGSGFAAEPAPRKLYRSRSDRAHRGRMRRSGRNTCASVRWRSAADALPHHFRRALDLGLHHPLVSRPRRAAVPQLP